MFGAMLSRIYCREIKREIRWDRQESVEEGLGDVGVRRENNCPQ